MMTVLRLFGRHGLPVLVFLGFVLIIGSVRPASAATSQAKSRFSHIYYANKTDDDAGKEPSRSCAKATNTTCSLRSALRLAGSRSAVVLLQGARYTISQGQFKPLRSNVTLTNSVNLDCPGGLGATSVLDFSSNPDKTNGLMLTTKDYLSGIQVFQSNGDGIVMFKSNNTLSCVVSRGNRGNGINLLNAGANRIGVNTAAIDVEASINGGYGLTISGGAGRNNLVISGRYLNNTLAGIVITGGATLNVIGGTGAGQGNTISGNNNGIEVSGSGTRYNTIAGNRIGTDDTGTFALPNRFAGVSVREGANNNYVGGAQPGMGNVISGNGSVGDDNSVAGKGIELTDSGTTNNSVGGNRIGVDITGTKALPNGACKGQGADKQCFGTGVVIRAGAGNNAIGGAEAGRANIISGNWGKGIEVSGNGSNGNIISNNYIGTDATGTAVIANSADGIGVLFGASFNIIGTPGHPNIISGNGGKGIDIVGGGSVSNVIQGNFIGTDKTGSAALGNAFDGIAIEVGANGTTIGGSQAGQGNVVSGNGMRGIELLGVGTNANIVQGNLIGTDASGGTALPNATGGIGILNAASQNTIGGANVGQGNVISGNGGEGIYLLGQGTAANVIQGNYVGTDKTGSKVVTNTGSGIQADAGASNTIIGGSSKGMGNIIGGNFHGIVIAGAGTNGTVVKGNFIGTDATQTHALPNLHNGVLLLTGASGNTIGGQKAGEANVINGNGANGVEVSYATTLNNTISANAISGNGALGINLNYDVHNPNGLNGGADSGPNNQAAYPTISTAAITTNISVSGTANPSSIVEVYLASGSDPATAQGAIYLGTATAGSNGAFAFSGSIPPGMTIPPTPLIVATSTLNDPAFPLRRGSTSQFSPAFAAGRG